MWFKNRELKRLFKAKIDGLITGDEEKRLNRLLEGNDAKREELISLLKLENDLNLNPVPDESIDIKNQVMSRITSKKQSVNNEISYINLFNDFINPVSVRFAIVLLAGIVIGTTLTLTFFTKQSKTGTEMLTGSLSASNKQGISFANENSSIKLIPYQIGNLYYLNFMVDSRNELQFEVSFQEAEFAMKQSDYISSEGNRSTSFDLGKVGFSALHKTTFQIILEKLHDQPATITITTSQNQVMFLNKEITLD
jgi:hypothetical protein